MRKEKTLRNWYNLRHNDDDVSDDKGKGNSTKTAHLSKCLQILRRQGQRIALTDYTTSHDESQLWISNKAKISRWVLDKEDLGLLCALERTKDGEEELAQSVDCDQSSDISALQGCKGEETGAVRNRAPGCETEARG